MSPRYVRPGSVAGSWWSAPAACEPLAIQREPTSSLWRSPAEILWPLCPLEHCCVPIPWDIPLQGLPSLSRGRNWGMTALRPVPSPSPCYPLHSQEQPLRFIFTKTFSTRRPAGGRNSGAGALPLQRRLQSCSSGTSNKSEKPFATEAGYYMTSRADSGMQPPLLGNRADSLSAFQQELLLSLARYGEPAGEQREAFSQPARASGG